MMGNRESSEWSEVFSEIKQAHDSAYVAIDEAISLEEQEKPQEAIEKYKEGISLIDRALSIQIECPENPDFNWEKARVMIQKMKKTRGEVLQRINSIQSSNNFEDVAPPPSYDEAMSSAGSSYEHPRTYHELALALRSLEIDDTKNQCSIIFSTDNVRLYFISPDGTVVANSELHTLKVGIVESSKEGQPSTTFLQVGEWVYPLVPGVSPCYRTEYGAFIFPDLNPDVPGSSVGVILPPETDRQVWELLEDILHGIVSEQVPEQPLSSRTKRATGLSDTISQSIITGANYVQQGLILGAEKAGQLMDYGAPKIMNSVRPAPEPKPIPRRVQKGFAIAQDVTGTAVNVTGFIANKVGCATMALGRFLAPHIQKQGTKLLTTGFRMSEEDASEKVNGVLTVAAGAVEGFSTVYKGLETSAGILGRNLTDNTVKIVEHKYGRPSGVIAGHTLHTVGNIVHASHNIHHITPKGIAKHTVKSTGKALVEKRKPDNPSISQNHLYSGPGTSQNNLYSGPGIAQNNFYSGPSTSSSQQNVQPSPDTAPKELYPNLNGNESFKDGPK